MIGMTGVIGISGIANRRRACLTIAAGAVALLAMGCGSEDPKPAAATGPTSARTLQEPLPATCADKVTVCWDSEVKKNTKLSALAGAVTKPLQAAGAIQDGDQNRLVWAEFADSADAPRNAVNVLWGLCKVDGSGCSAGTASYTDTGAQISDDAGKAVARIGIGLPVLRKQLKFHAPDKDPTLLAPLTQGFKLDPAEAKANLGKVKAKTRRMVILNAYGPQVGLPVTPLADAAKKLGLFDSVEVVDFARMDDATAVLPTLTGLDVLVWVGAGVVEKFTDKPEKPLGITVSRGVFGDQLVYGKSLGTLLGAPPLGGPGLVVLAGSSTLASDYYTDKSTVGEGLFASGSRALVGFGGRVSPDDALTAVSKLLGSLAGGANLDAAMAAAGQPLLSPMDKTLRQKWLLPGKNAAFWGAKPPSKASMTIQVKMDPPFCTYPIDPCDRASYNSAYEQNKIPAESLTAGHATFVCPELQISGPYISCAAKDANSGADFSLTGVLRGRGKGDKFWLFLQGTANGKYKQMTVVAEGAFEDLDEGGGKTTLRYRGIGAAGPYMDQDNNCCTAGAPALTTIKNEPGTLELWP